MLFPRDSGKWGSGMNDERTLDALHRCTTDSEDRSTNEGQPLHLVLGVFVWGGAGLFGRVLLDLVSRVGSDDSFPFSPSGSRFCTSSKQDWCMWISDSPTVHVIKIKHQQSNNQSINLQQQ
jgi:hypothetical protein